MTTLKVNMSDFEDFIENIEKEPFKQAVERAGLQLGNEWMAKAIKRTPVGTGWDVSEVLIPDTDTIEYIESRHDGGLMKSSWHVANPIREGDTLTITVYNTAVSKTGAPYPLYVENGHRQRPGRFVPSIGKRLKKTWVPGQFMLAKSRAEMEKRIKPVVDKYLQKAWESL